MSHPYGRFTVRGSDDVENLLSGLVSEAAHAAQSAFSPKEYRALVMMGGYGRGEGGVEMLDGRERPHNNLDFLLIAESPLPKKQAELRHRLLETFYPTMQKYDIEIDVSVTSVWKLRFSTSLIVWYETRFGHKTILGDPDYLPSLKHFTLDRIPPRDALRLLVNRGTLLIVNEQLLQNDIEAETNRERIVRNAMKAIIGYGDALLFFLGDYHWSYVERKRRMQKRTDVPEDFRQMYDEAAEFRFRPHYDAFQQRDLKAWMLELRRVLEPIHMACEAKRLGVPDFTWEEYPDLALKHALFDESRSVRSWARKALNLLRSASPPPGTAFTAQLGCRVLGLRGLYPIVFPVVAYRLHDPRFLRLCASALGAANTDASSLRESYLRTWGAEADLNAYSVLRKWQFPVLQE